MAGLKRKFSRALSSRPAGPRGFTLIELLVTVAIVGILSATVYPTYMSYIARTNRAEAKGILMETAQSLERNYTMNNAYNVSNGAPVTLPYQYSPKSATLGSGTAKYRITADYLHVGGVSCTVGQCFTLSAQPMGVMANDSCGTLTLGNNGTQGANGLYNDATQIANGWQK